MGKRTKRDLSSVKSGSGASSPLISLIRNSLIVSSSDGQGGHSRKSAGSIEPRLSKLWEEWTLVDILEREISCRK